MLQNVVGKGSWKMNEKLESFKLQFDMKLERMKLEKSGWSWKVTDEVGMFQLTWKELKLMKLESYYWNWKGQ